jgi:hypothetical protein
MIEQLEDRQSTFVNLYNKVFAEYVFIYRINDAYNTNDLNNFFGKHQLFFQKIKSKNQQLNLMFVDSVFTNILADVVLEVFIEKASSFNDYINSKNKIKMVEEKHEERYFKFKFIDFINMLLYSNIASEQIYRGEEQTDRVYCVKNNLGELEYFSIYERTALELKLLQELVLEIDFNLSSISNQEVELCFRIRY